MSKSKRTTDHATIREWVEARNGKPARVQGTGDAFVYQEQTAAGQPSRFNQFVSR